MANPKTGITIGDRPCIIVLWRDWLPIVRVGLERYPIIGERFEIDGAVWVVFEDRRSYLAAPLASQRQRK